MTIDGARADAGPGAHLVGVIGSPIAPFAVAPAAQCGLRCARARRHLALAGLRGGPRASRGALAAMRRADVSGLSVTMPHKADVAALVDECSEVARRLGAVNCIVNREGSSSAPTPMVQGFVASLARGAGFTRPGGAAS